jgi:hypothetical protein
MEWIGSNERYIRGHPFLIIMQRTLWHGWRPLTYPWVRGRLTPVLADAAAESWPGE